MKKVRWDRGECRPAETFLRLKGIRSLEMGFVGEAQPAILNHLLMSVEELRRGWQHVTPIKKKRVTPTLLTMSGRRPGRRPGCESDQTDVLCVKPVEMLKKKDLGV